MKNDKRPEITTVTKKICPECRILMSNHTWDSIHMEEEHGYENGSDVVLKDEVFISVPDLLDYMNDNHSKCSCLQDLVEILEYSISNEINDSDA